MSSSPLNTVGLQRFQLRVELVSPLCSGAGWGRPGYVDREAVFDSDGLPCLPGRRLKGLWRDAYLQVQQSALGEGLPSVEEVFGSLYGEVSRPGILRVSTAKLEHAEGLGEYLRHYQVPRVDVSACYSEIRRQTKMDRESGTAAKDTLRATRLIRPNHESAGKPLAFFAEVRGILSVEQLRALILAALALKAMGTSRNRGFGSVRCRLGKRVAGEWVDLTPPDLDLSSIENEFGLEGEHSSDPPSNDAQSWLLDSEEEWASLAFRIVLKEPAVFPRIGGDPNTVVTHDYVPGPAIHGLFANRFLNGRPVDSSFWSLFDSDVRFLPAYPALTFPSDPERLERMTPMPQSLREVKGMLRFEDDSLRYVELSWNKQPDYVALDRLDGWTSLDSIWNRGRAPRLRPFTSVHYHHTRANDPRVQRALGTDFDKAMYPEVTAPGSFFTYEALAPRQVFAGRIEGPASGIEILKGLIADGERVNLGRSRAAEYGANAVWSWLSSKAEFLSQRSSEEAALMGSKIIVTLLSPLVSWNDNGHLAPVFPEGELADALKVSVTIEKAFVRTGWQGGFVSHLGLPKPQMPCLEAGTVFVLALSEEVSADTLRSAERQSYGLRTPEGFGQLGLRFAQPEEVVETNFDDGLGENSERLHEDSVDPLGGFDFDENSRTITCFAVPPRLDPEARESFRSMLLEILKQRASEHARNSGLKIGKQIDSQAEQAQFGKLTGHLIGRLIRLLAGSASLEAFAGLFRDTTGGDVLRETVKRNLRAYRAAVNDPKLEELLETNRCPLDRLLRGFSSNWESVYKWLVTPVFVELQSLQQLFEGSNPLLQALQIKDRKPEDEFFARSLVKDFLLTYLRTLALRKRGERPARGEHA